MAPRRGLRSLATSSAPVLAGAAATLAVLQSGPAFASQPPASLPRVPVPANAVVSPAEKPATAQWTGRAAVTAALLSAGAGAALRARRGSKLSRRVELVSTPGRPPQILGNPAKNFESRATTPQVVPVLDMEGKQIGEEIMCWHTAKKSTANYVVHLAHMIWQFQQKEWTAWCPRRSDVTQGTKPWAQKGSGRARHGDRYSPIFGRSFTNNHPHGLDSRKWRKHDRRHYNLAVSTVFQSKWRRMTIVDGLEDWKEARHYKLEGCLKKWLPGVEQRRYTLIIARSGKAPVRCLRDRKEVCAWQMLAPARRNKLYLSSRWIKQLSVRGPKDMDCFDWKGKDAGDAIFQALKARHIIISREAFYDLTEKFGDFHHPERDDCGWAWKSNRQILIEKMHELVKEYPYDKDEEIAEARKVPLLEEDRKKWAKAERERIALEEAA